MGGGDKENVCVRERERVTEKVREKEGGEAEH